MNSKPFSVVFMYSCIHVFTLSCWLKNRPAMLGTTIYALVKNWRGAWLQKQIIYQRFYQHVQIMHYMTQTYHLESVDKKKIYELTFTSSFHIIGYIVVLSREKMCVAVLS